jgi:multidrug resistance efflux pump
MPEINSREIHSEEVQEIMGNIPGWVIRWGLTLIFAIFAMIVAGSYFFSFKEIVTAPLMITTFNTPAILEARASGKIDHLLVENEQAVQIDQVVAVIENTARYQDVLLLQNELEEYEFIDQWDVIVTKRKYDTGYLLGELQNQFISFKKNWKQFSHYLVQNHLPRKLQLLELQINKQKEIYEKQLVQLDLQREDLKLSRKSFQRDSILYKMGTYAITLAEYERSLQSYIQKEASFLSSEGSVKNAEASILRLQENKVELQLQFERELNQYRLTMDESYQMLRSALEQWKERYVIASPIEGKISFTSFWNENQVIKAGDRLATVVPKNETQIIAKAIIPTISLGKVEKGQSVNIKLAGFPYMEYGMLRGLVKAISLVPEKEGYVAEISLTSGMTTSYSEQLKFIQEMEGTAEIITEEIRFIYRFINPLRALMDKGFK